MELLYSGHHLGDEILSFIEGVALSQGLICTKRVYMGLSKVGFIEGYPHIRDGLYEGLHVTVPQIVLLSSLPSTPPPPPPLSAEIQRRQKLCRAEYGNWWDRQHSTVSQQKINTLRLIHNMVFQWCALIRNASITSNNPLGECARYCTLK